MRYLFTLFLASLFLLPNPAYAQVQCSGAFTKVEIQDVANALLIGERGETKNLEDPLNKMASEIAGSKIEVIDVKDVETKSFLKKLSEIPVKVKDRVALVHELVRTYKQLRADIKSAMTTAELDEQLDAFRGFHHDLTDVHFDRRTWKPLPLDKITKNEVVGIEPEVYAKVAGFAMEVEAPTMPYSYSTGESFSNLFPKIGRFMGKDKNQKQFAEETKRRVCESAWCAEEERHAGFLAQIIYRITGKMPSLENSNNADLNARDEKSAMSHLAERQTYEWNATSSYAFLMAHSSGHLRDSMSNILKDEVKHLTIMSSAYTYIYGYRPWKRFSGILKNTYDIMKKHDGERTDADALQKNKMVIIKMLLTHLIVEAEMRKYLKTLPHQVLRDYFDSPSDLPKLGESGLSEAQRAEIESIRKSYVERRKNLEWWDPKQAAATKKMLSFADSNKEAIDTIIAEKFSNFMGAETPDSPADMILRSQMDLFIKNKQYRPYFPTYIADGVIEQYISKVLYDRMREYQIRNNKYESQKKSDNESAKVKQDRLEKKDQEAKLMAPPEALSAKVISMNLVADGYALVRVEKPQGMDLKAGSSVNFGFLDNAEVGTRILSLASSPDKNYFEFAVKLSGSDFKKKFENLKAGDVVTLKEHEHRMAFDVNSPMVMIATGVGITPFRSMMEYARDTQLKTPMWLLYGNRSEIPFVNEINDHSQFVPKLSVQHTLSKPSPEWTGSTGRIDKEMLSATIPSVPSNAKFYIVGSPEMIKDTRQNLLDLGISDSQIVIEVFFATEISKNSSQAQEKKEKTLKEDEMICFCKRVTTGQILSLVKAGNSVNSAISCTGAGSGCGGCAGKIAAIKECIK